MIMVVTRMVVLRWQLSDVCSFVVVAVVFTCSDCYQDEIIIKLHVTGMERCKARALTTLTP